MIGSGIGSSLGCTLDKLGDGKVVHNDTGETIFKLDSFENNPIVKPQDLGLVPGMRTVS